MQNYFILAITVCALYLGSEFAMKRFSKRNTGANTKQDTMRQLIIVFVSVVASLFAFDKLGFMRLATLKTVAATPAFTGSPDF